MNLKSLYIKYFDKDLQSNLFWINQFEIYENQLPENTVILFSKLLNAHHIWNCRLFQKEAESDWNDELSPLYFERLAQDNFRQSIEFIEHSDSFSQTHFYEEDGSEQLSSDILMRILLQSTHFRAQLELEFKKAGIELVFSEI